jgi:4-hydroxybenzoate polyprenyltransferase
VIATANLHGFFSRWWIYFEERFPLLKHGLSVGIFTISALSFSSLIRDDIAPFWGQAFPVAFATTFLFFLQLRIADEFKDFEEDSRWRPYRPVPRGLVTLRSLAVLGVGTGFAQAILVLLYQPRLIMLLIIVWAYFGLMSVEFFVRQWLKARPLIYMGTHMVIIPLITLYVTAFDWLRLGSSPSSGLWWFLAMTYFSFSIIEIGRKLRAPEDEEKGVETYSVLWGPKGAVLAWLGGIAITSGFAVGAARQISYVVPVATVSGLCLMVAVAVSVRFLRKQEAGGGKIFDQISALCTVLLFLALGPIPLLEAALRRAAL